MLKNGKAFLVSRNDGTGINRRSTTTITGSSQRRKRSISQVVVALFVTTWFLLLFQAHISISSSPLETHEGTIGGAPNKATDVRDADILLTGTKKSPVILDNTSTSSWYGWQPVIHPEPDCIWRQCFKDNHGCRTTCRDEPEAMGNTPLPQDIPHDWVPDVTMLRRMFLSQKDANGNPWPPSLSTELCEPIGVFGGHTDENKELLDAVPILAEPLLGTDGPKVLCMIYTMASAHPKQVRAIRETWAGGCDGFLAFSTESDPRIPAISIPHDGEESYNNMWQKVRSIWRYVDEHYADDFDFFFLGGDDLFVLPQNLRSYLATLGSPDELIFAGRRFKGYGKDNYFNSGGAGYTLSRGTLKLFAKDGLNDPRCAPEVTTSMEDVMVAQCLRRAFGIGLTDTRDAQGRERFHPFSPGTHFHWTPPKPGKASDWYQEYNQEWGVKLGAECCSPDSVSFHYLKKPAMVRHVFTLLYNSKC